MKSLTISDVKRRLNYIPSGPVVAGKARSFEEQAERAIASQMPQQIIFVINNAASDPTHSLQENTMMNLLEALVEYGTESQADTCADTIMREYVSRTRDAKETQTYMKQKLGRAKSKMFTKPQKNLEQIQKNINAALGAAQTNFKKNTSKLANAVAAMTPNRRKRMKEEALVDYYGSMLEYATQLVGIDRILENYNRVSKRFNLDRIIQENTPVNGVADTAIEICRLVDTYDMPVKARYNTCLETVWYGLHKNAFTFNVQEAVTAVTDYYTAKGGNSFACKSILEASVVFDKDDYRGDIDVITEEDPEDDIIDESGQIGDVYDQHKDVLIKMSDEIKKNLLAGRKITGVKKIKDGIQIIDFQGDDGDDDDLESTVDYLNKSWMKKLDSFIRKNNIKNGVATVDNFNGHARLWIEFVEDKNKPVKEDTVEYMVEGKLSAADRRKVKDADYGLPKKRKYPMPDESHVKSAIRMFNHCGEEDETELARNIKKKIKQYGMSVQVGPENRFSKYYTAHHESRIIDGAVKEYATYNSGYIVEANEKTDYSKGPDFNKILDNFRASNEEHKENKLQALVRKLYTKSTRNVVEETPNFFAYIRGAFILGSLAINPVITAVLTLFDQCLHISMERDETEKMMAAVKNEIKTVDKKIASTKNEEQKKNLQEYRKALAKGYNKISDYHVTLLNDEEQEEFYDKQDDTDVDISASDTGDNDFGDLLKDFDMEGMEDDFGGDDDWGDFEDDFKETASAVIMIDRLTSVLESSEHENNFDQSKIHKILQFNPPLVSDLEDISNNFPTMVSRKDLRRALDDIRSDIQVGSIKVNLVDKYELEESYQRLQNFYSDPAPHKTANIFYETYRYADYIRINQALNEIYEACIYRSPLTEASFTNSIKLASQKIKKSLQSLSDKEKTLSKNIDVAANNFARNAEKAMTNDRREGVIKGSVIPSASRVLKGAIATAGLLLLDPVLAVIGVIGYIGISAKLNHKERQLVLDEIDVELKMCDKYIDLAEGKNDMKALKQLYTIQKELQKQRARIILKTNMSGRHTDTQKMDKMLTSKGGNN